MRYPYCSVILVAAGSGTRMGAEINKLLLPIGETPVILYTLSALHRADCIDEIILVAKESEIPTFWDLVREYQCEKVTQIVRGGKTRQESVQAGLSALSEQSEIVLVHDGARALVTPDIILRAYQTACETDAAACGVYATDTLKEVTEDGVISATLDRSHIVQIQTPQAFRTDLLREAYQKASEDGIEATDDCALVERLGVSVHLVEGSGENLKITRPEDLIFAQAILAKRGDFV